MSDRAPPSVERGHDGTRRLEARDSTPRDVQQQEQEASHTHPEQQYASARSTGKAALNEEMSGQGQERRADPEAGNAVLTPRLRQRKLTSKASEPKEG